MLVQREGSPGQRTLRTVNCIWCAKEFAFDDKKRGRRPQYCGTICKHAVIKKREDERLPRYRWKSKTTSDGTVRRDTATCTLTLTLTHAFHSFQKPFQVLNEGTRSSYLYDGQILPVLEALPTHMFLEGETVAEAPVEAPRLTLTHTHTPPPDSHSLTDNRPLFWDSSHSVRTDTESHTPTRAGNVWAPNFRRTWPTW